MNPTQAQTIPATAAPHQPYVDEFATGNWGKKGPGFVREMRREAMRAFAAHGFPTTREDAWRNTSVRDLTRTAFHPLPGPARLLSEAEVSPYRIQGSHELVLVDGHFDAALSRLADVPDGLEIAAMSQALDHPSGSLEHNLGRHAGDEPFVALNTAFFQDGAFIEIAPQENVEAPIHVLHLSTEPTAPAASHLRHLVLAGERSEATVVESYVGLPSGDPSLTTCVTELVAGAAARIQRVKLQRENLHAFHVGRLAIREDRDSIVHDTLFSIGAALSRNEIDSILGGPGAEVRLAGLFLGTGRQHVDMPTWVDHAVPHTTSRELYKGVLDGAARGVFLGNVKVRADAQGTNSEQVNRNLLLSPHALVETTPQLEIHADDVKCSHGSTIGQLSDDALFFLRSRGIGEEPARLILTQAFAHEVLEAAPAALRPVLDELLAQWFACRKVQGAMG
jgi:Fe-S cluster assembly protein SufD